MSDKRPTTRRDLMKPGQMLGLAVIAALFAGVVTLVSMGLFQDRFPGESSHALLVGLIVAGITFVVTLVVLALLMLAVQPEQITHRVDGPVLIGRDQAVADEQAAKDAAAARAASGRAPTDPGATGNGGKRA
ncbi:amino acid transporter [Microbacterium terrisoli]|jgi:hypothetical protein|uniref:amino acid transporter n=1 Tax=Microbacterium terrisoli TaxID=3242192 RepID=UPI00280604AE|nr:amino acid transporter [Microbacterium protaetiae]